MNDKPKVIKKQDIERRANFERSLEVNYMLLLVRKYPEKAKEAVEKLFSLTNNNIRI